MERTNEVKRTAELDRAALECIQALMTAQSWCADTVSEIADILNRAGYRIDDIS